MVSCVTDSSLINFVQIEEVIGAVLLIHDPFIHGSLALLVCRIRGERRRCQSESTPSRR